MRANQLEYKTGAWTLFKDKEYLGKYEYQDELEKSITDYIRRYEGPVGTAVDKEWFIKRDGEGRERGIADKAVVDYIISTVNFFVVSFCPYIYRHGVFVKDENGIEMKDIIQSLLPDRYITNRNRDSIYNLLIGQKSVQRRFEELNNYPDHWINFRNGLFDVKGRKLYKHNPKYLSINQIPHDLNLAAKDDLQAAGPETIRFLSHAIPDRNDQKMLFQYVGYCMTKDTCFQKFMIIKGTGGTGKSSVIRMIQNLIGDENVSGVSLENLTQRFYPSMLHGKLLNACADISSAALTSVDVIKKATGEDLMMYERKGMDPSGFYSYAKLLFSANQIPLNMDEKSDALYRRMLVLAMNQKPDKIDLELDEKLAAEVDYLIWKGIDGLRSLYEDGRFAESASSIEEVEKLHRAADTVKAFMDECTTRQQGTKIKQGLLYEHYTDYCKSYGRRSHGSGTFYRALEEKGYTIRRKSDGRYVMDVTFKDEGFVDMGNEKAPL